MRAAAVACRIDTAAAGRVRGNPRCEWPEGPGRDRRQARFHIPIRRLAGESTRHSVQVSACAPVQSDPVAAACDRVRLPARCRHADLPLRLARRPLAGPADRMGRARASTRRCGRRGPHRRPRSEGRAAPRDGGRDRTRCFRRADDGSWERIVLGRRRDRHGARLHARGRTLRRSRIRARRAIAVRRSARAARTATKR